MAARASSAARYAADVPTYSSVGSACPDQMRIAHRAESLESSAPAFPPPPCDLQIRSSRPAELHRQPLTEPSVRLSPHSAPIRQTHQSSRSANVQRYPRIPSPAVVGTDSLGLCGV